MSSPDTFLVVNASARGEASTSRQLANEAVAALKGPATRVTHRDLSTDPAPFVTEEWVGANFTAEDKRTAHQRDVLAGSDALVRELQDADTIIIATPIYNFGVPASLKAWIDQIARARVTFRYTPNGPEGLLKNKRAVIVASSGGTPVGSDGDFATGYLKFVLGFVGITDVTVIAADSQGSKGPKAMEEARAAITGLERVPA